MDRPLRRLTCPAFGSGSGSSRARRLGGHLLAGLAAAALLGSLPVRAQAQAPYGQTQRQAEAQANRERCTNGVALGGLVGGVVSGGGLLNRLGAAAIGATAGCVINRGVNEGR